MFTQQTVTNPATESKTAILNTWTMQEFFTAFAITQVNPKVAVNKNGYPFITLIDKDNKAENIYFSKTLAPSHPNGMEIVKGFFDSIQIVNLQYETGETRLKLSSKGGNRLDAMGLL
jgi:hypothetical protein